MREVSTFLLELRNGSESHSVHEIPPAVPENEALQSKDVHVAAPLPSGSAALPPVPPANGGSPLQEEVTSAAKKARVDNWVGGWRGGEGGGGAGEGTVENMSIIVKHLVIVH